MKKRLLYVIALFALFLVAFFLLLNYPQLTINKQLEYRNFKLYANEPIALTEEVKIVLDSVNNIIQHSDYHAPDLSHHLFLSRGTFYEKLLNLTGQHAFAFAFSDKQVYLAEFDFSTHQFFRNNNEYEIRNMIQLIAHESVHNQQYHYSSARQPAWIGEGYAEYVSYLPLREKGNYNWADAVREVAEHRDEEWLKSEYGYWDLGSYKYYRVIVEYLLDQKGMKVKDLLKMEELNPAVIFAEMEASLAAD